MKLLQKLTVTHLKNITGGSFGFAVLMLLTGLVAFNGQSFYHDYKIGMEMGMVIDPLTAESNVWVRVPRSLHIKARLSNFVKFDENGTEEEADLMDVISMQIGGATVQFDIMEANEEEMPVFSNLSQSVAPMAYIKEPAFPFFQRIMLILFAAILNNWSFVKFMIIASSTVSVILGLYLRRRNNTKAEDAAFELSRVK